MLHNTQNQLVVLAADWLSFFLSPFLLDEHSFKAADSPQLFALGS